MAGILAEFGHDVQQCENGIEASVWLATAVFDVLVTDMVLYSQQGLVLRKSCARLGIRTVTLTGREFHADKPKEERPSPLLETPFRFSDLRSVLTAVGTVPSTAAPPPMQLDPLL